MDDDTSSTDSTSSDSTDTSGGSSFLSDFLRDASGAYGAYTQAQVAAAQAKASASTTLAQQQAVQAQAAATKQQTAGLGSSNGLLWIVGGGILLILAVSAFRKH